MDKTILHCDLNGFFASVELLSYPELADKPVAVCGNPENRHGIILAKNEIAKSYNIKTAETIWQAKKKCPNLILLSPHHELYSYYSKKINEVYLRFTNQVEPFGIDESWLDVTNSKMLFDDGKKIADTIRETIKKDFNLTVSVGVSFNKVFAKLGSDYKKPDATTVISKENFKQIVYPLPASDLLYVGNSVLAKLNSIGIKTIGDIAASDKQMLIDLLGKHGSMLYEYASGADNAPVLDYYHRPEIKSVGNGTTFSHDLTESDEIKSGIMYLCETISARLIKQGFKAGNLQVSAKYNNFKTVNRQSPLTQPTLSAVELYNSAMDIVNTSDILQKPICALTVTAGALCSLDSEIQLSIFDEDNESHKKHETLAKTVTQINKKFGKGKVSSARTSNIPRKNKHIKKTGKTN